MAEPVIRLEKVGKSFSGNTVLEGIDLKIYEGELICIVGGSGVGKTVLAKHFNGLVLPDEGDVYVYGRNLKNLDNKGLYALRRNRIGYVFQEGALYSWLDVYANVASGLRREDPTINDRSKDPHGIEDTVRNSLTAVGLDGSDDDLLAKLPDKLSGGQKRRVAVARSIAYNPKILIYDEPTAGLDPRNNGIIARLMIDLYRERGITTIVVSHDPKTRQIVRGRVIMLYNKGIKFNDTYKEYEAQIGKDNVISRFEDVPI